jgi:predicted transposase/invertase (TIGR01784 family)
MTENIIQNPHDRFVRHMMTKPKVIEEFFQANLPANIKSAINFNSIKLEPESLINSKLQLQITDLLYSAEFNQQPGYIYLVVEHLSNSQRLAPFRMLKYTIDIMQRHLDQNQDDVLPIVYPLIIYGGRANYTHSTDLFDLFAYNKELAKNILWQPCKLIDLTKTPDEELKQHLWYGTAARLMKYIFAENISPHFKAMIEEIKIIERAGEISYIKAMISYVAAVADGKGMVEFKKVLEENLSVESKEGFMTFAEAFIQQGVQQGMQHGMMESKREMAIRMIKTKLDKELIAEITGFSMLEVNELEKQMEH